MILRTSLLALALFSFGCGKSEAEARGEPIETAPSASVAVQAAPTPSPKAEGAELLPLAVGQWTRHSVRRADGTSSEMSYKVVGTEGDAFWIEIESGAPGSGTVISLLITLKDRKDPASSDILAARMKLPGQEMREVRGDSLNSTKDAYKKNMAQMFVPGLAGMPQEDVTVPAWPGPDNRSRAPRRRWAAILACRCWPFSLRRSSVFRSECCACPRAGW